MRIFWVLILVLAGVSCERSKTEKSLKQNNTPVNNVKNQKSLVKIAADFYPPWTEGTEGFKPTGGISVEIVKELFQRLKLEVRVIIYPFVGIHIHLFYFSISCYKTPAKYFSIYPALHS